PEALEDALRSRLGREVALDADDLLRLVRGADAHALVVELEAQDGGVHLVLPLALLHQHALPEEAHPRDERERRARPGPAAGTLGALGALRGAGALGAPSALGSRRGGHAGGRNVYIRG